MKYCLLLSVYRIVGWLNKNSIIPLNVLTTLSNCDTVWVKNKQMKKEIDHCDEI